MVKAQQTFVNRAKHPIYVSIEPICDCYKLQPEDRLTVIYFVPSAGDALEVYFLSQEELLIDPNVNIPYSEVLVNGRSAEDLSWNFEGWPILPGP